MPLSSNQRNILLVVVLVIVLLLAFSMDDPKYYQDPTDCPVGHATPCN